MRMFALLIQAVAAALLQQEGSQVAEGTALAVAALHQALV
jgi:hypothetical protein